jgi:TonB-linked SusC/RagA family outer membrane protein
MAAMAAVAIVVGSFSAAAQAASGTITGLVSDAGTSAPLAAANVRVTGTQIGAQTTADGHYTIRGVTAGTHDIQVNRIGYEAKHVSVSVTAGQTATANVTLSQAAFSLATVVTTVTGATSKAEISNTVATIDVAAKADESSAHSLGEMLSGQAAGVQVSSSGAAGGGSRIRIRGQNSLSLNNAPVVYVDGIKVNSDAGSLTSSSTQSSRFDDINPEEIESIDVLKGPAAATLYGTEAANGVIIITTKKGKAGTTRVSVFGENGISHDPAAGHYRDLWEGFDNNKVPGKHTQCQLVQVSQGTCHIDSLFHNNVLNQPSTTPIQNGYSRDVGMQVSGGTDRSQYFVSGEYNSIMGTYKMPQSEIDRLTAERGQAPEDFQIYPNADLKINLRANLSAQLGSKADFTVSSGYLDRDDRQPPNEDNSQGLMVDAIAGTAATDQVDSRGIPLGGYRTFPIGDILSQNGWSNINRFTNSLNVRVYPLSWLNLRGNVGYDYTAAMTDNSQYVNQGPVGSGRLGTVTNKREETGIYTIDLGATATTNLWRNIGSKLSIGSQAYRNYQSSTQGRGTTLPPGATTAGAGAVQTAVQATSESITLGNYAEEVLSFSDQLFVTGAARYDGNSAFGKNFKGVLYPKVGASWLLSQAGWFPRSDQLNSLRARFTYGTSGVQPGGNDATRYYSSTTADVLGVDTPGVTLNATGNASLKPEFSSEYEGGLDATVFNNHTTIELTYFNHHTKDALISRPLAPSLAGIQSVTANLGSVRNRGFEYTFNNRIIDNNNVGFDVQLTGSATKNNVITLGEGVTPVFTGNRSTQRNAPGYPLFGYWGFTYKYNDVNNDKIITPNELTFSDTSVFMGSSYPTIEMALNPRLELLHRKLAISAQFDHKEGDIKFDNTLRHQCSTGGQSCRALYDVDAGLAAQAAAQADNSYSYYTGQYENGKFTRLREVSVSYQLPDKIASHIHASRALLVATGRNLHVWTPYSGVDPEATVGNQDARGNEEYFSTPPLRFFTVRVNLTF